MKLNSTNLILTILLIINFQNVYSYSNCTSSTTTIGCLICDDPTTQSYAFNQTELKYTCTGTLNCTIVAGNICISCAAPFTIDAITNLCIQIQGCIFVQNGACFACEPLNFVLINGNCYQKQIDYCTQYTLFNNNLGCLTCTYIEMDPVQNCTFSSTVCQQFDYQLMKCKKCPTGTIIHSDGRSCYSPIPDCQVYSSSSTPQCLICKTNYVLNTSSLTCILGQSNGIMSQVLSYNLINASPSYTYLCLNNLLAFNQSTFDCTTAANEHCAIRNSTGTLCLQCIPGYFLRSNDSLCRQCSVLISNCALCSNQTVCTTCLYGYYLQNTTSTSSVCMPCSSFGCLDCSSDFDANGKVRCISCPANKTLFSGSCIACQDSLSSFSVSQSKCLPCNNITNCISCIFPANSTDIAQLICLECSYQNYYNSVNLACQLIQAATNVTFDSAYEILRKVAPGSDSVFYPDGSTLMSSCNSTDGFICICNSKNLTSLCKNFTLIPNISALVFSTNQIIAQYPDQLRMAAELPSFNLQTHLTVATYEPLTLYQFWSLLSAITLTILRDQQNGISINSAAVARIFNHATAMINVFSDQKITILRGNGFYFKFIPKGLISGSTGDDTYIKTNLPSTGYVIIFIHYPRLDALSNGSLTGTTYVLTDNTQATFDVTVRKTRYSSITSTYKSRIEGSPTNNNVTLNSGQILINQFPKSTAVLPQGVQIYGLAADSTSDIYASQRIENIFYSQSWLYILFFILLYLIFIPLCAIVDCCETQQTSRKKVGSEQPSDNKEQSDENIVRINYRDFFPVYNVGNTPRPLRLSKLCLFIVNMQHIISFLTIIYVNLPGSLPVAAIALVIPAYLCTVIMGYICGALFRNLPGRLKWLINLFSLGYWILWIFVMRDMSIKPSKEYRLFILVFSILSFFLDLTIDALQTLLVYFSIKQGEKQVSLFQCLAKWLSLRGFYQFDKLAKQIEYQQ